MRGAVLDFLQRSPEWHAARLGRLCSSHANDMLATIKSGEAAGRRNLRMRLLLERVTGKSQEREFQSEDMANGIEREAMAVALYEARTGQLLCHSGYVQHATLLAGWSPDGHTDDFTGFVEAKCPKAATHYETLKTKTVPTDYLRQMTHGGFWIGGAAWGDFVSYHPDFPPELQLFVKRIVRADVDVAAYETAARAFLAEVDQEVSALRTVTTLTEVLQEAVHVD